MPHTFSEAAIKLTRRISITTGGLGLTALLNDSATADLVWGALPIEAPASTWGDEIYFTTDIHAEEQDSREVVEMGDVGYWPAGSAVCLFFGPTPASVGDEIRPASPVNVIGRMEGDPTVLKGVAPGQRVRLDRA